MNNNQPQNDKKNDQTSKPIIVDNKADAAKAANVNSSVKPANDSASKPADVAKTGAA